MDQNTPPPQTHFDPTTPTRTPELYSPPIRTFTRFAELPTELQMQIWSFAADDLTLPDTYVSRFVLYVVDLHVPPPPGVPSATDKAIVQLRRSLMQTCTLSKMTTLKRWREEIAKVVISPHPPKRGVRPAALLDNQWKAELLNLVDDFIKGSKGRVPLRAKAEDRLRVGNWSIA